MPSFGLYFHLPFCIAKCPYCDFYSIPLARASAQTRQRYMRALRDDLRLSIAASPELTRRQVATVYFGGGTPSLAAPEDIAALLAAARALFTFEPDPEITLECNPAGPLPRRLAEFQAAGINRVSLGVQSFQPELLKTLGRPHTIGQCREAVRAARELKFASWGIDLMFAVPGSTPASWESDLEQAVASGAPHLSIYGLTLHEGTAFYAAHAAGTLEIPGEEEQREMFLRARRVLMAAGYEHYEISNYALPGHRSRHNSLYWTRGEYLGAGAAAHSSWDGRRSANPDSIDDYLICIEAGLPARRSEIPPDPRSLRGETIMLALRQCGGVRVDCLSEWMGIDFPASYAGEIAMLRKAGLLEMEEGVARLTEEGLLLSDSVFEAFF